MSLDSNLKITAMYPTLQHLFQPHLFSFMKMLDNKFIYTAYHLTPPPLSAAIIRHLIKKIRLITCAVEPIAFHPLGANPALHPRLRPR